jgi:hypothetical protein
VAGIFWIFAAGSLWFMSGTPVPEDDSPAEQMKNDQKGVEEVNSQNETEGP